VEVSRLAAGVSSSRTLGVVELPVAALDWRVICGVGANFSEPLPDGVFVVFGEDPEIVS
jgi:hypothetical protein